MGIAKKIFAVCFMFVLLAVIASSGFTVVRYFVAPAKTKDSQAVQVEWKDLKSMYPFPASDGSNPKTVEADAGTTAASTKINSLQSAAFSAEDRIEQIATTKNPYYNDFVFLYKTFDKWIGKNSITSLVGTTDDPGDQGDIIYNLGDNYFAYAMEDCDITDRVNNLVNFADKVQKKGIPVLYVDVPNEMGEDAPEAYKAYKDVYPDVSTQKRQQILDALNEHSVSVLTLDKLCPGIYEDPRPYFFQTDHHWLPTTGLKACQVLADALNQQCGYHIDPHFFDEENYKAARIVTSFGSEGRKVTDAYATPEQVPILLPAAPTDFSVQFFRAGGLLEKKSGSAEDTLIDYIHAEQEHLYDRYAYTSYTNGDHPLIRIHNQNVHDGTHLLLIKFSQADCMVPQLANAVEYLDVIDLRVFDGSLQTFIEQEQPDAVAFVYGTRLFGNAESEMAFDFR